MLVAVSGDFAVVISLNEEVTERVSGAVENVSNNFVSVACDVTCEEILL